MKLRLVQLTSATTMLSKRLNLNFTEMRNLDPTKTWDTLQPPWVFWNPNHKAKITQCLSLEKVKVKLPSKSYCSRRNTLSLNTFSEAVRSTSQSPSISLFRMGTQLPVNLSTTLTCSRTSTFRSSTKLVAFSNTTTLIRGSICSASVEVFHHMRREQLTASQWMGTFSTQESKTWRK